MVMAPHTRLNIADILASKEFLSNSDASDKVVRIGSDLVVKHGHVVPLSEADTLR